MKKKEFIQNGIILPIVSGLLLFIAFFFLFRAEIHKIIPIPQGTQLAYYDTVNDDTAQVDLKNPKKNDCLGTVSFGQSSLKLRYDADYSSLSDSASVMPQSAQFGDTGCIYLKTVYANAINFKQASVISVSTNEGEHYYSLVEKQSSKNEYDVLKSAPNADRSLVLYYQDSDGAGLTSKYQILIFKEVA